MKVISNKFKIKKNSFKSEGDGVVIFPEGLVITDGSTQRNGTKYDIDSLDISKFPKHLTADHVDTLSNLIGNVYGVQKRDGKVTINKIVYAVKENPYARMAYDLLIGGFSDSFSTETMGNLDHQSNTYFDSELCGLSQVVTPNNYAAVVNTVHNSLEKSKEQGLDITGIEEKFMANNKKGQKNKMAKKQKKVNARAARKKMLNDFSMDDFTNIATLLKNVDTALGAAGQGVADVATRETGTQVDNPIGSSSDDDVDQTPSDATTPDATTDETPTTSTDTADDSMISTESVNTKEKETNQMTKEEIAQLVADSVKNAFDGAAKEPEFKIADKTENGVSSDWQSRFKTQINSAFKAIKNGSIEARQELNEINKFNLNELQKAGKVSNSFALSDMGNFVLPPEVIDTIQGIRTNYDDLLNATQWLETDSTRFWYTSRSSDVLMQSVSYLDNGSDGNGNLKPITGPSYQSHEGTLYEIAGVFPIMASALEFSAVDLLTDIAEGFQHSYAQARAQLVIASLQQAVEANKQFVTYNQGSTAVLRIKSFLSVVASLQQSTPNGVYIMSQRTLTQLMGDYVEAGINGPLGSTILIDGTAKTIAGTPYIIVPNDLLPTLGGTTALNYVVNDKNVTIDNAVFYADLSVFTGRTHGGLKYDTSDQAMYETSNGGRSAFQRNEIVLRGSAFIGGAVTNDQFVSAITLNSSVVSES